MTLRVIDGLPYELIVGAECLKNEESVLDFGQGKGLKHSQDARWMPFFDHTPPPLITASLTDSRAPTALDATHRTPQSHEDKAWENGSTLEWDVYLSNDGISADGDVSKAVRGYAVVPMSQDKQLAVILPKEGHDLGKTAMVGVARGVRWWKPGTPVTCKLINWGNETAKVSNSTPIAHIFASNSKFTSIPIPVRRIPVDDRPNHAYLKPPSSRLRLLPSPKLRPNVRQRMPT